MKPQTAAINTRILSTAGFIVFFKLNDLSVRMRPRTWHGGGQEGAGLEGDGGGRRVRAPGAQGQAGASGAHEVPL